MKQHGMLLSVLLAALLLLRRLLQRQGNAHAHGKAEPHRESDGEPHRKSHREPHNGRFPIDRAECDGRRKHD